MNAYQMMRTRLAYACFLTAMKKSAQARGTKPAVILAEDRGFFAHKVVCA
ncbi:hypothetical protein [Brucella pseudogrignonensis]|uniref:Transposase n=1 Tax=Brucella pseudogrignonensis TaxID=419475 RepID=A0ABU1MC15_9HYPH|nr:hypothetical protein [Brucella pseudogrignonensis]MDR6433589.1 hypothetical protein [Brucella pseudogrignonensis]